LLFQEPVTSELFTDLRAQRLTAWLAIVAQITGTSSGHGPQHKMKRVRPR
jgi:hypothetical protein